MKLRKHWIGIFISVGFVQATSASVILDEDFDDNTASYSSVTTGDSGSFAINIRPASNIINTSVNDGFDSYFGSSASSNNFLVIGDRAWGINGDPNGDPDTPTNSLTMIKFGLGVLAAGSIALDIGFDFAFDTNHYNSQLPNERNADDFFVQLLDGAGLKLAELLSFDDVLRNESSRKGYFSQTVNFNLASTDNVYLSFGVKEYSGTSSSAVGIDNIKVASVSVPEPATFALMGVGLVGLIAGARKRNGI